ncbi:hypothetical protein H9W90_03050 [Polaribacter pectinis]|uniref:Alpha-ketoglutarate decarboxylase n=1 Tax=Polaribacter pectinis TaxID=2738844 RepID=A0A7G9LBW0_9FLAO|nr:hypothetical protein [Polaribacter pectinis]QNM86109.1 hypothetical protein H9W90_03050 [Polaribacter pectinis]
MKKFLCLFLFILSINAFSQKSDFWSDVQFGGGFTLGFGNNQTTVGISPSAIYNFNNGFSLGTGVNYLYSKINDFSTNVYGASIISLYQTNFGVQFSGDLDYYFANQKNLNGNSYSTNFPALHLGIAYNQGRFAVGIRYDVLYDENKSVFASPISPVVRFYF